MLCMISIIFLSLSEFTFFFQPRIQFCVYLKRMCSVVVEQSVLYILCKSSRLILLFRSSVFLLFATCSVYCWEKTVKFSNCRCVYFSFYISPVLLNRFRSSVAGWIHIQEYYVFLVKSLLLCNVLFLPLVIFIILKSLYVIYNIATQAFFCLLFAWYITFFYFNPSVSFRQDSIGSCFRYTI